MNPDSPSPPDPNLSDLGRAMLGGGSGGSGSRPSVPWMPPSAEELARLLPGYEILSMLGRGGMGAVYMGRQVSLDRPVAIKILSGALEDSDLGFKERFKNEARAMAKLSHPGIVAVHDSGETADGLLYIVMEYVDGTDVSRMIAAEGRLHTEYAMAITAHVCDALAYAHERGIIHRDIKPANIMVGYDGVVKVADFGLAKVHGDGSTLGLTMSGVAMGTMHFMAPEALEHGVTVDHRADLYAVGVMLYQMLTGKVPRGMFEMPSLQMAGLDPRYDGIIAKAMREDREVRYQSARELRADLDGILTQPVEKVETEDTQPAAALPTMARPQRPGGKAARRGADSVPKSRMVPKSRIWMLWVGLALLAAGAGYVWLKLQENGGATTLTSHEGLGASVEAQATDFVQKTTGNTVNSNSNTSVSTQSTTVSDTITPDSAAKSSTVVPATPAIGRKPWPADLNFQSEGRFRAWSSIANDPALNLSKLAGIDDAIQVYINSTGWLVLRENGELIGTLNGGEGLKDIKRICRGDGDEYALIERSCGAIFFQTRTEAPSNIPTGLGPVKDVYISPVRNVVLLEDGGLVSFAKPGKKEEPVVPVGRRAVAMSNTPNVMAFRLDDGTLMRWGGSAGLSEFPEKFDSMASHAFAINNSGLHAIPESGGPILDWNFRADDPLISFPNNIRGTAFINTNKSDENFLLLDPNGRIALDPMCRDRSITTAFDFVLQAERDLISIQLPEKDKPASRLLWFDKMAPSELSKSVEISKSVSSAGKTETWEIPFSKETYESRSKPPKPSPTPEDVHLIQSDHNHGVLRWQFVDALKSQPGWKISGAILRFHTADLPAAGTDSDVFVTLNETTIGSQSGASIDTWHEMSLDIDKIPRTSTPFELILQCGQNGVLVCNQKSKFPARLVLIGEELNTGPAPVAPAIDLTSVPDVRSRIDNYQTARHAQLAELTTKYRTALVAAKDVATRGGILAEVTAAESAITDADGYAGLIETNRSSAEVLPLPPLPATANSAPARVQELRDIYVGETSKIESALVSSLDQSLATVQTSLVQTEKLAEAKALENFRREMAAAFENSDSGSITAADSPPTSLEEALRNYYWEWRHGDIPPDKLIFGADGVARCDRFSWRWRLTGPNTVEASDATTHATGKQSPEFKAILTFDDDFSNLTAATTDGKARYSGMRLERIAPSSEGNYVVATLGDWPGFRGPDSTDVSRETGLLKQWPEGGPQQVWSFNKAGLGYSGFSIVAGTLYTMGANDKGEEELIALDAATGNEKWRRVVGGRFSNDWGDGPRATPTVDGDRVYAMGGRGDLLCASTTDGKRIWDVSMTSDLGGKLPIWGYTESVLVDGDSVICTPGSKVAGTLAALNKMTGAKVWQSSSWTDEAQYSSAVAANFNGTHQIIQRTMKSIAGVNARDGKVLWKQAFPRGKTAVIPTPIIHGNTVYVATGYNAGSMKLDIGPNHAVTVAYENIGIVNHHGGVILVGNHVYGFSDRGGWACQEYSTGNVTWAEPGKLGKGAIHCAEGMLYLLEETSGTVVLIEASPEGWKEHGRFTLSPQSNQRHPQGKIWTHPVVSQGKLYLRDQEIIYCFNVKA